MPKKARLVLYGNNTVLSSERLLDGNGRLHLVGAASHKSTVAGVASTGLSQLTSSEARSVANASEHDRLHLEFGPEGFATISAEVDSVLLSSPLIDNGQAFLSKVDQNFILTLSIQIGNLYLSWWERRGANS